MDFAKPINWGMKKIFPENMTVEDSGGAIRMAEKLGVKMAEHFDDAIASAILNEMGAQGVTSGAVLNKKAIFDAMEKQIPQKVLRLDGLHRCPRCKIPIVHPTGVGNEHYCCYCGQMVTWRRE